MQKRKHNEKHEKQYEIQGSCCLYCSEPVPFEEITIDHFHPKKRGGKDIKNRVYSCRKCNGLKGHKTIDELREVCFTKIAFILDLVANKQGWKITDKQLVKFRRLAAILKGTKKIIENDMRPKHLF